MNFISLDDLSFYDTVWVIGCGKLGKSFLVEMVDTQNIIMVDNDIKKRGNYICGKIINDYKYMLNNITIEKDKILIAVGKPYDIYSQIVLDGLKQCLIGIYNKKSNTGKIYDIEECNSNNSYSQYGEDIILKSYFHKKYTSDYKGIYVDIGAYNPLLFSNTFWAYKEGWFGVNIDASEDVIKLFELFRPQDKNICRAIYDKDDQEIDFYVYDEGALNTTIEIDNLYKEKRRVYTSNINTVLNQLNVNRIDLLDIDAEGTDESIIMSLDFLKFSPEVIMMESWLNLDEHLRSQAHLRLNNFGYKIIGFCINTVIYAKSTQ